MRIVDSARFVRAPRQAMVLGPSWVYASPDGRLYATLVAGPIDEPALRALFDVWRVELRTRGHLSLCDATALGSFTPPAFVALGAFLVEHRAELGRTVERQALVLPRGFIGATVAGYYRIFPPPYPYELFDERAAALTWLGYAPDALASVDEHLGADPVLRALREALADARRPTVDGMARRLSISTRSLQRRLRDAGTSFAREQKRVQLERAMMLLRDGDQKLAAIADAVGCASLATFSELFTREVGMPPSEWRAQYGKR